MIFVVYTTEAKKEFHGLHHGRRFKILWCTTPPDQKMNFVVYTTGEKMSFVVYTTEAKNEFRGLHHGRRF